MGQMEMFLPMRIQFLIHSRWVGLGKLAIENVRFNFLSATLFDLLLGSDASRAVATLLASHVDPL